MPSQQQGEAAAVRGLKVSSTTAPRAWGSAGSGGERCLGWETPSTGFGQPAAELCYFSKSD